MLRAAIAVPAAGAEEARARMLELFPGGFEEREAGGRVELAAYTDAAGLERLRAAFGEARAAEVADDWHERWKEFHQPARLGSLWIGPPWRDPDPGLVPVVIDPGRAFGTGAHATTRLCLELLEGLPRGSLLDVGCGSGVLAIAAGKLGFGPLLAVDSDPNAVEATAANAAANGVDVDVRLADALAGDLPAADVAVANIALAAVLGLVPRVRAATVVTSGYRADDEPPAFEGLERVDRRELDFWAADVFRRA